MSEIELECSCQKVKGKAISVNSSSGTRIVCCCDDCQSFARHLGHENTMLDQYGGTDIFQMPVSHLKITQGIEEIACVRLSSKGMYRWYVRCCNTPIGNTLGFGVPFIGVIHNFMSNSTTRDADLGKSRGYLKVKFANKLIPEHEQGPSFRVNLRSLSKLIVWKLRGLNKPSLFFNKNGEPIVEPTILN